jgi:hypothetical protein
MAQNLQPGERVFVPTSLLPNPTQYGVALIQRDVLTVADRSATLDLGGAVASPPIATSKLHRNLGILVIRVGDLETEPVLLDPLAKSILHFARLFVDDSFVYLLQVRSLAELEAWLPANAARFSHVVLIGHSDANGLKFAIGGFTAPAALANLLGPNPAHRLTFISLACESGRASFAQSFSRLPFCEALVAPFHSVHGAIASQYCQSFFAHLLLLGETLAVAHRHAREHTPGSTSVRLWQAGALR